MADGTKVLDHGGRDHAYGLSAHRVRACGEYKLNLCDKQAHTWSLITGVLLIVSPHIFPFGSAPLSAATAEHVARGLVWCLTYLP